MKTPQWQEEGWPHIWLPYAQMQTTSMPLPVVGAKGTRIKLADGCELIDGIASWWSVCHGYNHPHITQAITKQAKELQHVMFAGLAHEPAYRLARRLVNITPSNLTRVFFSDSGSTAVEVAMKMAVQYWKNQNKHQKNKFISFKNAYHGDTMGAMSLGDPKGMHGVFKDYMPKQFVVKLPRSELAFQEFDTLLKDIKKSTAALIIEPLVQGAGGMKFHEPDVLAEIHRLCKKHNILFIADEIATGFGRTSYMFACQEAAISPDIMCVGKALTGGSMTLAATLASEEMFEGFLDDELKKAFMHGPTYMANPLACAAANASLDLFEKEPRLEQVGAIEQQLYEELQECKDLPNVRNVRVKGAIGVVQLRDTSWEQMFAMRQQFIDEGVWLRPFGDIVYIMPPFTITAEEISKLTNATKKILKKQ